MDASTGSDENPARYGDSGGDFKSTLCWNSKKKKVTLVGMLSRRQ